MRSSGPDGVREDERYDAGMHSRKAWPWLLAIAAAALVWLLLSRRAAPGVASGLPSQSLESPASLPVDPTASRPTGAPARERAEKRHAGRVGVTVKDGLGNACRGLAVAFECDALPNATATRATDAAGRAECTGCEGRVTVSLGCGMARDAFVERDGHAELEFVIRSRLLDTRITVRDPSGHGIAAARVVRYTDGAEKSAFLGSTDAAGTLRAVLLDGEYVGALARGWRPSEGVKVHAANALELDLVLRPGEAVVEGTVADESGRPIGGARASLVEKTERHLQSGVPVESDAAGRFRIEGAEAGPHDIVVRRTGYVARRLTRGLVLGEVTSVAFVLEPELVVRGIVRSSSGEPVAGARVQLTPDPSMANHGDLVRVETRSRSDGSYELRGATARVISHPFAGLFTPGKAPNQVGVHLECAHPNAGSAVAVRSCAVEDHVIEWNPELGVAHVLRVRVVSDGDGQPLAGVELLARGSYKAPGKFMHERQLLRGTTDASGSLRWNDCLAQKYRIEVLGTRWTTIYPNGPAQLREADGSQHEIRIPGEGAGRVVLRVPGAHREDASLSLANPALGISLGCSGTFDNGMAWIDVPCGNWLLRAFRDHRPIGIDREEVTVALGSSIEVHGVAPELTELVIRTAGTVLPTIWCVTAAGRRGGSAEQGDRKGELRVKGLPKELVTFELSAPNFRDERIPVDLRDGTPKEITWDPVPAPSRTLDLRVPEGGSLATDEWRVTIGDGRGWEVTRAVPPTVDGGVRRFVSVNLPPGDFVVRIEAPGPRAFAWRGAVSTGQHVIVDAR